MKPSHVLSAAAFLLVSLLSLAAARAQPARPGEGVETWVSATDGAPGADLKAQDDPRVLGKGRVFDEYPHAHEAFRPGGWRHEHELRVYDRRLHVELWPFGAIVL
jgi:hypothetical protein